jgi:hypothetical protein
METAAAILVMTLAAHNTELQSKIRLAEPSSGQGHEQGLADVLVPYYKIVLNDLIRIKSSK